MRSSKNPFDSFKLLLLDDDVARLKPLLHALDKRGFTIDAVSSAQAALSALEKDPYAVVISDERMPEQSGVDFLIAVSRLYPHIIRILFTAYSDHDIAIKAINQGNIFRYIVKSQPVEVIATILQEALAHYATAAESAHRQTMERAETALTVLRDVRYDWGNVILTQQLQFKRLEELLATTELRYSLNLDALKKRCEAANAQVETSLREYFENPFLDSTLTEPEVSTIDSLLLPIRLALSTVKHHAQHKHIEFCFNPAAGDTFEISMQRDRLKAAIGLILQNAVESIADQGRIHLTLSPCDRDGSPWAQLAISDTGKGIPSGYHSQIFDPLFKSPDKQGHMGIGLTFAKTIISDHGGEISFVSREGEGSTFAIHLPLRLA